MQYFLFFWTIAIAIVPGSLVLAIFEYWWWSITLALLALIARTNTIRTVVRTGAFGTAPRACSSQELLKQFKGLRPTVVGSAWGFFLQRRTAKEPVLSMRNFTGIGTGKYDGWWAAGTTIKQVLDHYDKTFPSHPSQDDITIGSWFATGSHGSGGDAGKSSSSVLHSAEVVCFDPPSIKIYENYEKLRAIFDRPNNHVITWVKFHNLVPNAPIQKRAFDVVDIASADKWLSKGAILRVLFIAHRFVHTYPYFVVVAAAHRFVQTYVVAHRFVHTYPYFVVVAAAAVVIEHPHSHHWTPQINRWKLHHYHHIYLKQQHRRSQQMSRRKGVLKVS